MPGFGTRAMMKKIFDSEYLANTCMGICTTPFNTGLMIRGLRTQPAGNR
ncbi:MAG: hypothetical protein ABI813_16360 [Bacteroidota bacterium]